MKEKELKKVNKKLSKILTKMRKNNLKNDLLKVKYDYLNLDKKRILED